jgi:hypothetical protein
MIDKMAAAGGGELRPPGPLAPAPPVLLPPPAIAPLPPAPAAPVEPKHEEDDEERPARRECCCLYCEEHVGFAEGVMEAHLRRCPEYALFHDKLPAGPPAPEGLAVAMELIKSKFQAKPAAAAAARWACVVCFEDFQPGANTRAPVALGCGHPICAGCLLDLRADSRLCPTCRAPIVQATPLFA